MVPQPSARIKAEMYQLRLVDGAELLHELLGASHDGLATGLEHLAGVEALALKVLFAPWFHHENTASLDLASKGCERAYGARGESRTHTPSRAEDFESPASAIPPLGHK